MTKILVIHGAGMNMRGRVQIEVFGSQTLAEYDRLIHEYERQLDLSVVIVQSNIQGELVNVVYDAHDGDIDAALINPAGFTSGAPALVGAISQVRFPTIEVHFSNPASRGGVSVFTPVCKGAIVGFGTYGYYLGLLAAKHLVEDG